jgi:hypothetical protein
LNAHRAILLGIAGAFVVMVFVTGLTVGRAGEPVYYTVSCWEGDVNDNGHCTLSDAIILQQNVFRNPEWADGLPDTANPCVPYDVFDGVDDPDYPIVNSIEEYITPRGGMYLINWEHPLYASYKQGTPIALIPC